MAFARRNKMSCKTVAVRYRFVWKKYNNTKVLEFLPHTVRKLEHIPPTPVESKEVDPEKVEYLDDVEFLRSLDPKEWKKQDHYKVLGIPTLRFDATDEIIRIAYRKKVLKHHPDKRKAKGEEIKPDDDYFTCITMAHDTLKDPKSRRAYDSVDPEFNDYIPTSSEVKQDFYKVCAHYFNLNSRWSEKSEVPSFGGPNSTRQEVDAFYNFWYDFKSWREFSYLDEEDTENMNDREERRHYTKINKAERLRKKKIENARIRALVDVAYNNDPRVKKFKSEQKDLKQAARRAKEAVAQQKLEEEQRVIREAKKAKEAAEAAEKQKLAAQRQEKEAMKKAAQRTRKSLREFCQENNYFADNMEQTTQHVAALESAMQGLSLAELEKMTQQLHSMGKIYFLKEVCKKILTPDEEKRILSEKIRPRLIPVGQVNKLSPTEQKETIPEKIKTENKTEDKENKNVSKKSEVNINNKKSAQKLDKTERAKVEQKKEVPAHKKEVSVQKKEVPVQKKEVPKQKKEVPKQKKEVPKQKKEVPKQKKEVPIQKKDVSVQKKEDTVVAVPPEWSEQNLEVLNKALAKFQAGTKGRWENVCDFMNSHGNHRERSKFTAQMVSTKAKKLKKN